MNTHASRLLVMLVVGVSAGAASVASAQTARNVGAGGNLQAAIDAALPGDTIILAAGATYVGNFVLPVKAGAGVITIRSSTPDHLLPAQDGRIEPRHAPLLAKLRSPNSSPALVTAAGAHHYRLLFLEFMANVSGLGNIIELGDGSPRQNTLDKVPFELTVDRVYIHGDPIAGQKRGIALNSASTRIINSYISDIKAVGQDSQAICGWNGPGPYLIRNNFLEGAGENVMFGGSDPAIRDLVPSDIQFIGNHVSKPLSWRGSQWSIKNLLELKNARRVRIDGNLFENNWLAAQTGYAILMKSENQDGAAPWTVVEQVQFTNNVVRQVSSAINLLGRAPRYAAIEMNNISFRNNLFMDVSAAKYGGNGRLLLINGGSQITFDHNTAITDGATTVYADGAATAGLVFINNVMLDRGAAIHGSDTAPGNGAIARYFPGAQIIGNIIAGADPSRYPGGNYYPSIAAIGFRNPAQGDYRLSTSSPYVRGATDGRDPGYYIEARVEPPPEVTPPQPPPIVAPPQPPPSLPPGTPAFATPHDVGVTVNASTVTLLWHPPSSTTVSSYILEAGTAPGITNAAHADIGHAGTSLTVTDVPAGVYYVRIRAVTPHGVTAPSPEIEVRVGAAVGCDAAPQQPTNLAALVNQQHVEVSWAPPAGACSPTHYVLLAGSDAGLSNLAQAAVGSPRLHASAAPGTYYVRVVAVNAYGTSAPSNEILVTLRP